MYSTLASLCLGSLLAGAAAVPTAAQDRPIGAGAPVARDAYSWSIGITTAFARVDHTGGSVIMGPDDPGITTIAVVEPGGGTGFQAGLALEYPLDPLLAMTARLVFDRRAGRFELLRTNPSCDCGGQVIVWSEVTEITHDAVTTDLLISTRLVEVGPELSLAATAGISFGRVVARSRRAWQKFDSDSAPQTNLRDEPITGASDWRLSAKGGISAALAVGDRLRLRPGVFYDHALSEASSAEAWRINSLLVQLDAMLAM